MGRALIIDVHCHYTLSARKAAAGERFSFEPAERAGAAPYDSRVAPRLEPQLKWRLMKRLMGIDATLPVGQELDRVLERIYDRHLRSDGPIDRYVLLAFDEYHDDRGRRPGFPARPGRRGSDIYTSNSFVRDACRRAPDRFLFGASVHPYRENAGACLEEVSAAGACLLKWLPLNQNIDIEDPRTGAMLAKCAELGLPLLVHYSEEFTLATNHPEFMPVRPLLRVLERLRRRGCMPTTIVAHVATPVSPVGEHHSHRALVAALAGEFADAPLYADISALTALGKFRLVRALAARQDLHHKLLFGSDFPVPLTLRLHRRRIGRLYEEIRACRSWPQQAALAFRALGFNEIVFHRAAQILPNVDHFAKHAASAAT